VVGATPSLPTSDMARDRLDRSSDPSLRLSPSTRERSRRAFEPDSVRSDPTGVGPKSPTDVRSDWFRAAGPLPAGAARAAPVGRRGPGRRGRLVHRAPAAVARPSGGGSGYLSCPGSPPSGFRLPVTRTPRPSGAAHRVGRSVVAGRKLRRTVRGSTVAASPNPSFDHGGNLNGLGWPRAWKHGEGAAWRIGSCARRSIRTTRAARLVDASVDPNDARCARLKGLVCVRPPADRAGPNAGPPS
jgi:hypothetical protein